MRLEAELPPYPAQAGAGTAFGIPSGRHSDPGCSRAFYSPYPQSNATRMIDILNLTFPELERFIVEELGQPKFRAAQVWQWIWQKHATSFDAMTDVSKQLRAKLAEVAEIVLPEIVTVQTSCDGTEKLLLRLRDGALVETVILPSTGQDGSVRIAQCVSSQIGCAMGCTFCSTGTMGFIRNMTAGEILSQVLVARMRLGDNRIDHPIIRNLVFMGMGEPLDNLDEVLKALEIMTASYGYGWSPKRITLSTVGLRKGFQRFIEESECHLAVSLHSPVALQRRELMPAEKSFSITEMVDLLKNYDFSKQRRLSFEYIVFKGVNDSLLYAKELLKLLRGLDCRINLIRFHAIPGVDLEGADMETMTKLRDYLTSHGLFTTIRASRGEDIFAACGMLSTAKQEENKQELI